MISDANRQIDKLGIHDVQTSPLNILYVSDDRGCLFLGVSLLSLLENNQECKIINVFVLDDNISMANKCLLETEAKKYNRTIVFLKKPHIRLLMGEELDSRKWPDNIFCRLFLPRIFREYEDIERILYIDTDTLILCNLTTLWDEDLNGYACGAVLECMNDLHKKCIGLDGDVPYFNSGLILIDIERWRELKLESKCRNFASGYLDSLEYPDEGIINGVLQGNFKILHPRYNLTTVKSVFSYEELRKYRKSKVMYKESEYLEAIENPAIIHFSAGFMVDRPWIYPVKHEHPFHNEWMKYYNKSEWKDEFLIRRNGGLRSAIEGIIRKLPRPFVIGCMSIVYCYFKPLKYLMKSKVKKTSKFAKGGVVRK